MIRADESLCNYWGGGGCNDEVHDICDDVCYSRSSVCDHWWWDQGECEGEWCHQMWDWGCEDGYSVFGQECITAWGCEL